MARTYFVLCDLAPGHPRYADGVVGAEFVNRVSMEEGGVKSIAAMGELIRECLNREDIEHLMLRAVVGEDADD